MKTLNTGFLLVGMVLITSLAQADEASIEAKYGGEPVCNVAEEAPMDVYFGPSKMSVIGIENNLTGDEYLNDISNEFSGLSPNVVNGHFTGELGLNLLQAAILDVIAQYPMDCHVPSYLFRLAKIYNATNQPDLAAKMEAELSSQYPQNTLNNNL